jgi:hypothetical protein
MRYRVHGSAVPCLIHSPRGLHSIVKSCHRQHLHDFTYIYHAAILSEYELDRLKTRDSAGCPRESYPVQCSVYVTAKSLRWQWKAWKPAWKSGSHNRFGASLDHYACLHQRPHGTSLTGRWLLLGCRATHSSKHSGWQCAGLQVRRQGS